MAAILSRFANAIAEDQTRERFVHLKEDEVAARKAFLDPH